MPVTIDGPAPPTVADGDGAPPDGPPGTRHRLASWIVLAVPALVLLVASWNYRWVQDDAFINFRIIGNLLAGHGPVFNVGERVEAYSDPLWLFLLAAIHEVLPFVTLEWTSVILGIAFAVGGVVLAGRGVQRLAGPRGDAVVVPVGLYVLSVVAGVWEYVTGGLEMGMVFFWIGLSFWLLVRVEARRDRALRAAVVIGLGSLIRPELILESAVFIVALLLISSSGGWNERGGRVRRAVLILAAAAVLPVLYELWRMAYFALVVSNTALAKSAGAAWWGQGFTYLWNFVAPYTLWLPFVLVIPLMAPPVLRWWRDGDRMGLLVLSTPLVAGMVDVLYVVHVGGDYQHARLLLPGFFAICTPIFAEVRRLRPVAAFAVAGLSVWSLACIGWLRFDPEHAPFRGIHWISNARDGWLYGLNGASPVDLSSFRKFTRPAAYYRAAAATASMRGDQIMIVATNAFFPLVGQVVTSASTTLPVHAVVYMVEIGERGLVSGSDVYVFDAQSLANPIGSHTSVPHGLRPGGKTVEPVWMIARFGDRSTHVPDSIASPRSIADARVALSCGELASYLHAITTPLTWSGAWANLTHAVGYTTLTFSANPTVARRELCGPSAATTTGAAGRSHRGVPGA